jgi:hypothetical protein
MTCNIDYNSYYKKIANTELEWLPLDTKKLYEKNLVNRRDELEKYGWIDKHFTYKFNSHGFRCDEFTTEKSIMFLGASNTIGIGLPVEHTWTQMLSRELKLKCVNLGIGGSSYDTAFRLASFWIPKLQPDLVILLGPFIHRLEIISCNSLHHNHLTPASVSSEFEKFFEQWLSDDTNSYMNSLKNTLAIKHLCYMHNTKFINYEESAVFDLTKIDLARDLVHPGIGSNLQFLNYIQNNFN